MRENGGTKKTCLDCGLSWIEKDKKLTVNEQHDRDRFDRAVKNGWI